jgi:pyruvate/2-oxoglutarate dehydrogenase complex dihydrolipoamide dehydrogenase (E3) component
MTERYDVVVLGGGTAGEAVAPALVRAGRSVAVVEAGRVGGECPFTACMPSKAMLRSAGVRWLAARAHELGAVASPLDLGDPEQAWAAAVAVRDEVVGHLDDSGHAQRLVEAGVTLVRGRGRVAEPGVVAVEDRCLAWTDLIVATGSVAVTPPIDGIDAVDVWTSDDAWTARTLPGSLVVLGGGPVGVELAQAFARFGCRVTLIEAMDQLLPGEDPTVGALLARVLCADGIDVRTGLTAQAAEPAQDGVRLRLADGADVSAARLVIAAGRRPNIEGLGFEVLGLDGDLEVDERCRVHGVAGTLPTIAGHVWAAGDVTGVLPFTHTANYQGRVVVANLLGGDAHADYRSVPRTVYTEPEIAAVGLTPAQAREHSIDIQVATMDLGQMPRAAADHTGGGLLILVADTGRGNAVGAVVIGPHAGELITQAALAIRANVPLEVWADVVQPFPTYSEAWFPPLQKLTSTPGEAL